MLKYIVVSAKLLSECTEAIGCQFESYVYIFRHIFFIYLILLLPLNIFQVSLIVSLSPVIMLGLPCTICRSPDIWRPLRIPSLTPPLTVPSPDGKGGGSSNREATENGIGR